jgi:tetratricopeptide (TPR) repeat protein/tRNA A-37 threonylcarbamoyl transferase component Bud32
MPRRDDAPRNLLFGLLALQNGMITRDQLVSAFGTWTGSPGKALADLLVEQNALDPPAKDLLMALVERHLKLHRGDPEKSLAALELNRSTRDSLAQLGDSDIEATLTQAYAGTTQPESEAYPERTASYAVGSATSDGQRFRVLRPHARGGLGAVFVALDTELHREVAFKQILDSHADDPTSRQRFVLEAEVTGGLEHPGIVPVYGLGTDTDGRPYYAMRFIRGDSLREANEHFHADSSLNQDPGRRSLEQRKLLRRFLDVCNAIEYAHSRGVLHRDIKPGNVIVGRHGETMVVDWGLAKATGKSEPGSVERALSPSSASGSADTLPGSALGTPAYMSPEQAMGDLERLGPGSDVYSLGAMLYCLLTGKPPQEGNDVGAILRQVQRGEFTPPRRLDATIDPALEAICLKAMALAPEDRYASCRALAEDIERWMADEPVLAWREPLARRAQRWARRHRPAVTGLAVALLTGLIGLAAAATVYLQQRQAQAGRLALALREASLLEGQAQADTEGDPVKWHAALQAVKRALDLLSPLIDSATQRRVRALGEKVAAAAQAADRDAALLREAVDIRSAEADDPDGSASDAAFARAFRDAGIDVDALAPEAAGVQLKSRPAKVTLALAAALDDWAAHRRRARPTPVESWSRLVATARAVDPDPARDRLRQLWSEPDPKTQRAALLKLANEADPRDWLPQSLTLLAGSLDALGERAVAARLLERAQAEHPGDVWVNYDLGRLLEQFNPPRVDEAIRFYSVARALRPETAHELGHALERRGRGDLAVVVFRDLTQRRSGMGRHWDCLGNLLKERGDSAGAEKALARAVDALRDTLRLHPDYEGEHNNLGLALSHQGKLAQAIVEFREAIRMMPELAIAHHNLGRALQDQGKLAEAIVEYRELFRLKPDYPGLRTYLGLALQYQGKSAEAIVELREAIRRQPDDAQAHLGLGNALASQGKETEAILEFREAIRHKPDLAMAHYNLGHSLHVLGKLSEAIAADREAIRLMPDYAEAHCNLGAALKDDGRFREALDEVRKGHELGSKRVDWPYQSAQWVRELEWLRSVETRLPEVLRGEDKPRNAFERIVYAKLAYKAKRFAPSARLYAESLRADPALAEDEKAGNRYNAACAAALAGGGKGEDKPPPDEPEKARYRTQAIGWLEAELAYWSRQIETGNPQVKSAVSQTLVGWKADSDLAAIRDPAELAKLPESEQKTCLTFWADVETLLKQAQGPNR